MARPREFDRKDVLKKATNLFWDKGYEATSMEELVKATGLNRGSMYSLFKNKEGLFLATIDNYFEFLEAAFALPLKEPKGLRSIQEYLLIVGDRLTRYGRGCFFTNSVIENRSVPELASEKVDVYYKRLNELFCACLRVAQEKGEISPDSDIESLSSYLVCLTQGLAVMTKMKPDPESVKQVIQVALSQIK